MRIDKETMKVLSVDTRIEILKQLKQRQKMPSELSRTLGKNKSTVSEHLAILARAGLVTKTQHGKKWVYYSLTDNGREVLSESPVEAIVILALAALSFLAGFYNLLIYYAPYTGQQALGAEKVLGPAETAAPASPPVLDFTPFQIGIVFLVIGIVGFWLYWKKYR